ncbi:MAG: hypothetical protein ABRQ39_25510 [Candidatus Eremiobacterota bacterium]
MNINKVDSKVKSGMLVIISVIIFLCSIPFLTVPIEQMDGSTGIKFFGFLFLMYIVFSMYWGGVFLLRLMGAISCLALVFFPVTIPLFLFVSAVVGVYGVGIYEFIRHIYIIRQ